MSERRPPKVFCSMDWSLAVWTNPLAWKTGKGRRVRGRLGVLSKYLNQLSHVRYSTRGLVTWALKPLGLKLLPGTINIPGLTFLTSLGGPNRNY